MISPNVVPSKKKVKQDTYDVEGRGKVYSSGKRKEAEIKKNAGRKRENNQHVAESGRVSRRK